jgi:hypothetical protein
MKSEDKKNIKIKELGDESTVFISENGIRLAQGYNRVVFGGRGAYVEFSPKHMCLKNIHIPENQLFRLSDLRIYYIEFRSSDESNVKIYYQMKTVAYADYKIGMFYMCPTQIYLLDGTVVLNRLVENEKSVEFFE